MHLLSLEQESEEWLKVRLRLVTASRFSDILTKPRSKADKEAGALSDTANSYMMELAAQIITNEQKHVSSAPLEWGSKHESSACAEYEIEHGMDVDHVGICIHGSRMVGGSPDGLVGESGIIEIKCPHNSVNHLKTILAGTMPSYHTPQVQGNLWLLEREWCDFISFDPRIDPDSKLRLFCTRVYRDDQYIKRLEKEVMSFTEKLSHLMSELGINWQGVNIQEYI